MNYRRWSNITVAREAYLRTSSSTGAYPIEAFLEVAARCNLRCQMCAINVDARYRPRGERPPYFEPELFKRLRPIFPYLHRAFLFGLGEPLLNKHLVSYIRELASNEAEVCFNTNATLITPEKAVELAESGASRITVSIDGATASTYENIRRGARFADVIHGIEALIRAREQYGRPHVDLSFVAMASNVSEIPEMVELCARLGATGIHVEPLLSQVGSADLDEHYERENLGTVTASAVSDVFVKAASRAKELGVTFASRLLSASKYDYRLEVARQTPHQWTCSEPWASIWVTSSGEVRTCCINDTSFGNLFDTSFDEIWNGHRFRTFREQHARHEIAQGCGNCMRNGRMRNSTFFVPTQPVTYKPYFDAVPDPTPGDAVTLDSPLPLSNATDPILITGTLKDLRDATGLEVMIGYTMAAKLTEAAWFDENRFALSLSVPYLTDGAHVIWIRDKQNATRGWAHRNIYFWRAEGSVRDLHVTERGLVTIPIQRRTTGTPALKVGGEQWALVDWRAMKGRDGWRLVGKADFRNLDAGLYDAELTLDGRTVQLLKLQRLPLSLPTPVS